MFSMLINLLCVKLEHPDTGEPSIGVRFGSVVYCFCTTVTGSRIFVGCQLLSSRRVDVSATRKMPKRVDVTGDHRNMNGGSMAVVLVRLLARGQ